MEGLQDLTNALSNGTKHDPLRHLLLAEVRNPHPKLQSKISGRRVLEE